MDKQWNGEGRPPVGVKCEVRHIGVWHETTIVGHDDGLPVFKTDWCERYAYACGADFDFRPIRSAEDKAVAAMRDTSKLMRTQAARVYRDIRDGKIPGVKLDQ